MERALCRKKTMDFDDDDAESLQTPPSFLDAIRAEASQLTEQCPFVRSITPVVSAARVKTVAQPLQKCRRGSLAPRRCSAPIAGDTSVVCMRLCM
jgi:hypothetical protein